MPEYLEKTEVQAARAYSPAVITQGGRIAWLAGQTATRDQAGNDISGQFDAQVRTIFGLIDQTLRRCGGSLANLVTMTVFINDPRHGDRFVELRKSCFPDGDYPASALITLALATALTLPVGDAKAQDKAQDKSYPNWKGEWTTVIPRLPGQQLRFDPNKPYGKGQEAPLTEEYLKIYQANLAEQAEGGQ